MLQIYHQNNIGDMIILQRSPELGHHFLSRSSRATANILKTSGKLFGKYLIIPVSRKHTDE